MLGDHQPYRLKQGGVTLELFGDGTEKESGLSEARRVSNAHDHIPAAVSPRQSEHRAALWSFKASLLLTIAAGILITCSVIAAILFSLGTRSIQRGSSLSATEIYDVVRTALLVTGGVGALVGLLVAYRRQRVAEAAHALTMDAQLFEERIRTAAIDLQERVAEHDQHDANERRLTEMYTKAVEHLGSKSAAVQMGGLHALERIGESNPQFRQTIINVICSFLRLPYRPIERRPGKKETRTEAELEPVFNMAHVRWAAQDILHRHLTPEQPNDRYEAYAIVNPSIRRRWLEDFSRGQLDNRVSRGDEFWPGMHLDLKHAHLIGVNFRNAHLASADFSYASFYSASNFLGITIKNDVAFAGAKFDGPAHFAGGEFQAGAYFYRARFKSTASFDGCLFHGNADYVDSSYHHVASFQDSTFRGNTDFDGATFHGNSYFRKVRFEGEVDFSVAAFLYVGRPCGTQFRGKADFSEAFFGARVVFHQNRFRVPPTFEGATFSGDGYRCWPTGWHEVPLREDQTTGHLEYENPAESRTNEKGRP